MLSLIAGGVMRVNLLKDSVQTNGWRGVCVNGELRSFSVFCDRSRLDEDNLGLFEQRLRSRRV